MSVLAVVANDEHVTDVVIWAARIADAKNTDLRVLCWAFSPVSQFPLLADETTSGTLDALETAVRNLVESTNSGHSGFPLRPEQVTVTKRLNQDVTAAAVEEAADSHTEMVVAFARPNSDRSGRTNPANPLLRQSPCPTLILYRGGRTEKPCRRLVVAISDNAHDAIAVSTAGGIASNPDTQATIIRYEDDPGEGAKEVGKRELRALLKAANVKKRDNIKTKIVLEDQATEFLSLAEKNDLILIGANTQWPLKQIIQATSRPAIAVIKRAPPLKVWGRGRRINWLPPLSPSAYADLIQGLRRDSRLSPDFLMMLGLAAAIASLGLLQDSPAVVIGSMLLAPLMTPMIGCGLAMAQANPNLGRSALFSIFCGFLLTLVVSFVIGITTPGQDLTALILARGQPNMLDLLIALSSGGAAAYALARPNIVGAVAGVAIATALVPPLCSVGISLAYADFGNSFGAGVLFVTNLAAITLSASAIFRILGVTSTRATALQKRWVFKTVGFLGLVVVLLSVPLQWSLEKSVLQGKPQPGTYPLTKALNDALVEEVERIPGLHLVASGRPSSTFDRADVVLVLAGANPVENSLAGRLIEIVRKKMGDDSLAVEVYCLQNMWYQSTE